MRRTLHWFAWLGWASALALTLVLTPVARAQRPYIGYAYPAGGQVGTTTQVRLGGQGLDEVDGAIVSGSGVTARLVEYRRRLGNQEITLLNEQLKELKKPATATAQRRATASASGVAAEPNRSRSASCSKVRRTMPKSVSVASV